MSSIDIAYKFYDRHINDKEKIELLKTHNLKIAGSVPSVLWELFGAILTERTGAGSTGADLQGWEVKSAKKGGAYEYQYHLNTGFSKLKEDCLVNHLFCTYSKTYEDIVVRALTGQNLAEKYFKAWVPEYSKNYDASVPPQHRRQRYRKSIPLGYVEEKGILILKIGAGKLIYRDDSIIPGFNERNIR